MPAVAIPITDAALREVYAHAREAYPAECCGYVVAASIGDAVDTVGGIALDRVVRCRNAQLDGDSPIGDARGADSGFVIAGAELLAFARSFDSDCPARIVYHSHPNGRAYFSDLDQAMAAGPSYPVQHLVVGVDAERVTDAAQFAWSDHRRAYVEIRRWRP